MPWVLWDIVFPLIVTFLIGLITGWLLWRWRRRKSASAAAETAVVSDNNELSSSAMILIEERDAALERAEQLQEQMSLLQAQPEVAEPASDLDIDAAIHGRPSAGAIDPEMDDVVAELEESLAAEKASKAELEQAFMDLNNRHKNLSNQLDEAMDETNAALVSDAAGLKSNYESSLQQLDEQKKSYAEMVSKNKKDIASLNQQIAEKDTAIKQLHERRDADRAAASSGNSASKSSSTDDTAKVQSEPPAADKQSHPADTVAAVVPATKAPATKSQTSQSGFKSGSATPADDSKQASSGSADKVSKNVASEAQVGLQQSEQLKDGNPAVNAAEELAEDSVAVAGSKDNATEVDGATHSTSAANESDIKVADGADTVEKLADSDESDNKTDVAEAEDGDVAGDDVDNSSDDSAGENSRAEAERMDSSAGDNHNSVSSDKSSQQSSAISTSNTEGGSTASGYTPKAWQVPDEVPEKSQRDNLQKIKGIGPALEKLLHETGIYYFKQIAMLDDDGVEELNSQLPQFSGRIKRDEWVDQAKVLHREQHGVAEQS